MEIPRLKYKNDKWNINLPSIRAYTFDRKDVDSFIEEGEYPLDFDTNLTEGCNANCKYCATQSGEEDARFKLVQRTKFSILKDEDISRIINQLNSIGTKTFFLCSNGEPLLNPNRFLKIIDDAGNVSIRIITYTNGSTLNKNFLKKLYKRKINLVMKLESLIPKLNNEIILGENPTKSFKGYSYGYLANQNVPSGIIEAFEVYGPDSDCLGLETMILKNNFRELLDIREWAYDNLKASQFLKHLYPLGYVKLRGEEVMPDNISQMELSERVINLDSQYGFVYPLIETPDHYSYDARRFMNNCISRGGFPFRMFAHRLEGIYHSSESVPIKFGLGERVAISVFDSKGNINMQEYFKKIKDILANRVG